MAEEPVVSPFANVESHSRSRGAKKQGPWIWVILGIVALGIIFALGAFLMGKVNDPLRTLEPFPAARYFENYKSLAGSKFRAEVRVEADLGWKEGTGRLMLFTSQEDSRPIAVLVPFAVAKDIYFTKGQQFNAELEVREGGLIYGNRFKKD